MGRVKATKAAATLGKFLALTFFFIGIFYNFLLALIAVFIYFGAESENVMVMQLNLLNGYSVRDAMITRFTVLRPQNTLNDAVDSILESTETDFVIADEVGVQGILFMEGLAESIKKEGRNTPVSKVMDKEFKTLSPDEPLVNTYRELRQGNKNFFPVIRGHQLVGVIDMNNINEFLRFRASLDY